MTHQQNNFEKPAQTSCKTMLEKQTNATGETAMEPFFTPDDLIHAHTRADMIEDGDLIDVSDVAREAGFKIPVALTRAVWADCVEWTETTDKRKRGGAIQDESGRLWDVLYMAMMAARSARDQQRIAVSLYRVPVAGRAVKPRMVTLAMNIGSGDSGEPVITIMQSDED